MRQNRKALKGTAFLRALGEVVRARRKRLGLTTIQLAERVGDSPNTVMHLEAGTRNVTILRLAAIAGALDMSLPRLLKLAEHRVSRARGI